MDKQRIQVYANPEIKRRIELAAAKYNVPVTAYCLSAIQQQLADDDLLEEKQIAIPVKPTSDEDWLAGLDELYEKILARRGGKPIEVDILEQVREERDYELTGLH